MRKQFIKLLNMAWLVVAMTSLGVFVSCTTDEDDDPEAPIASFQKEIDSENFLKVTFTNFSQNAVSYTWDFGDSNTSTEESPVHIYDATGTYTVKLTATSADGLTSEKSETVTLSDPDAQLTLLAGIESKEWIAQREGMVAMVGPGGPYDAGWWGFGAPGATALAERPCILDDVYTFYRDGKFGKNTNGTFFMDSEANGGWNNGYGEGCAIESESGALTASGGGNYSAFGNGGTYTYEFSPSAKTLKLIGEGAYMMLPKVQDGADIGPNATSLPGSVTYEVLKLVDGPVADSLHLFINGVWTFLFVSYDDPANMPEIPSLMPTANFTYTATDLTAAFTNTSNDAAVNFSWTFGDGATSTEANPSHTYAAAGKYNVKLATNDGNGNTAEVTKEVTVGVAIPAPTEKYNLFSSTDDSDEKGLTYRTSSTSIVTAGVSDPASGGNLVAKYERSTNQYADSQFDFGGDESLKNFTKISMDVYFPSTNDYANTSINQEVVFYLSDREFGNFWEDWEAHTDGITKDRATDQWITISVNLNEDSKSRTNLDFLLIKIGGDNHTANGTYYIRNLKFE